MEKRLDGRTDRGTVWWMDIYMDRQMDRWKNGQIDGKTDTIMYGKTN
jgi:hypothetical protein